ncbi:MAG: hemolysin III family protein [Erysipelotrichaceae bacterium]
MMEKSMKDLVQLSFNEELANALTHGIMALIVLMLLPAIAVYSYINGGLALSISTSVYVICIFFMFLVSTLYHSMPFGTSHKYIFRILDHSFIYFAIAGTYTPIAVYLIKGWEGMAILIIQWSMVIFGVLYKCLSKKSTPKISLAIYLVMGWTAVLFIPKLLATASPIFLSFIVLGGILYSIGAYFYAKKGVKYMHVIWHFFINAASIAHLIAVVFLI